MERNKVPYLGEINFTFKPRTHWARRNVRNPHKSPIHWWSGLFRKCFQNVPNFGWWRWWTNIRRRIHWNFFKNCKHFQMIHYEFTNLNFQDINFCAKRGKRLEENRRQQVKKAGKVLIIFNDFVLFQTFKITNTVKEVQRNRELTTNELEHLERFTRFLKSEILEWFRWEN